MPDHVHTTQARPNDISGERYAACRAFLSNFVGNGANGKFYMMNYDLLLYWVLMHDEEHMITRITLAHDDGFPKDQDASDAPYVEWQDERHDEAGDPCQC